MIDCEKCTLAAYFALVYKCISGLCVFKIKVIKVPLYLVKIEFDDLAKVSK